MEDGMLQTEPSLKAIIEALIFSSEAPLSLDRLCSLLEEFDRPQIKETLRELTREYLLPERGITLEEVANGFQFRTILPLAGYVKRLSRAKAPRFSLSALETLAIVAYRQPVTRSEIETLRGVDAGGVLKSLLEKKLIRILGKKDVPGKPLIYGTTREFLELFSLKDLTSLPTLRDMGELTRPAPLEMQEELPLSMPGAGEKEGGYVDE